MPGVEVQFDLQNLSEQRDHPDTNLDPTSTTAVGKITADHVRKQLQQDLPHWQGGIDVPYRQWELRDRNYESWSPVHLFLLFFKLVLTLLVYHTNINAMRDLERKKE